MVSWGRIWGLFFILCIALTSRFEFGSSLYFAVYPVVLSAVLILMALWRVSGGDGIELNGVNLAILFFIATLLGSSYLSDNKTRSFIYSIGWAAYISGLVLIPVTVSTARSFRKLISINMVATVLISFIIIFCVFIGIDADGFKSITGFNRNTINVVILSPFFIYLAHILEGSIKKKRVYLAMTLVFLALILNLSRGVWISFTVGTIFMLLKIGKKREALIGGAGLIVAVFLIVSVLSFTEFGGTVSHRFMTIFNPVDEEDLSSSSATRFYLFLYTINLVKEFWLYGTGPGGFVDAYIISSSLISESSERIREFLSGPHSPHNIYLRVIVEGGVFSLIAYLFLFVQMLRFVKKKSFEIYGRWSTVHVAAFAGIIAIMVDGLFSESMFNWYFWYNAGVFLAACGINTPIFGDEAEGDGYS